MKPFLCLLLAVLTQASKDTLLTLSKSNYCIRDLVSGFVSVEDCDRLSDAQKTKLAMKMSQCLLKEMGKEFPQQCIASPSNCNLQGDAWSTFTTFFAHVDNLCHFYWQTLHHQRAQKLIGKLSQSSSQAEKVLKDNAVQTHKILTMQHQMHSNLDQSLKNQQKMANLINSSTQHISNLTLEIQTFVSKIHEDINNNYASIRNILYIINEGLTQVIELQGYIQAEITTISGTVFFVAQLFIVLFITSFQKYQTNRSQLLMILAVQTALELTMHSLILRFIGLKAYRYIFIGIMSMCLLLSDSPETQLSKTMNSRLSTPRLQRIVRKISRQQEREWAKPIPLSSLAVKVCEKWRQRKVMGLQ